MINMELKKRKMVLIDVETTGLDPERHQLLSVGMLVIENLKIIDKLEINIKHKDYYISPKALKTNKINILEHEEHAIESKQAVEEIIQFLEKNKSDDKFIVLGQNVIFDRNFLEKFFIKEWKIKEYRSLIDYKSLDLMQLSLIRNIEGKIVLEKQDLDTILKTLDICIPETRHSALVDCELEFEVFKRLINM